MNSGAHHFPAYSLAASCVCLLVLIATLWMFAGRVVHFLGQGQQLRVQHFTHTVVHNGPKVVFLAPLSYRSIETREAESLGPLMYAIVQNTETGNERAERGPKLLFLGEHDKLLSRGEATCLSDAEYVVVEDRMSGSREVLRGPRVWFPGPQEKGRTNTAISLSRTEYVVVEDKLTGEQKTVVGPRVWFPGAYEKTSAKVGAVCLGDTEYVTVSDQMTGSMEVVRGPQVWIPRPHDKWERGTAIGLSSREYLVVEDELSGKQNIVKGPCVWFPAAHEKGSAKQVAISLKDGEYVRLLDSSSGSRWVAQGKALIFLEPTWQIEGATAKESGIKKAWVLKANEYIRLLDTSTGKVTVHQGENQIVPGPADTLLDGEPKKAVEIDGEHAVVVRDKCSGQVRLVTEEQLFVPGPNDTIEKIQALIKLAAHEAMIVKDKDGDFQYYYGTEEKSRPGQQKCFFLPPGAEVVKHWWSRGPRRDRKDVSFDRFDLRPHFMKFEFNCRTSDNVELVLEGVFFWELVDLPALFRQTGDASGDMVHHIRSQFILQVARVTLKTFMEQQHSIAKTVLEEDVDFYTKRGIKIHSLEMTRFQCADKSTAEILEQIIQETTNRMNRLSQAESENEVDLFRTQGQLEQANLNKGLLDIQRQNEKAEAHVAGIAEAERVTTFLHGLEQHVPLLDDRIKMWQTLRKTDALSVLSKGGANLYFTPNDVDLSIETRTVPGPSC